jgi:hypothetical protein
MQQGGRLYPLRGRGWAAPLRQQLPRLRRNSLRLPGPRFASDAPLCALRLRKTAALSSWQHYPGERCAR